MIGDTNRSYYMNRHFFGKMQSDCRFIGLPPRHGSYQKTVTMGDKKIFFVSDPGLEKSGWVERVSDPLHLSYESMGYTFLFSKPCLLAPDCFSVSPFLIVGLQVKARHGHWFEVISKGNKGQIG